MRLGKGAAGSFTHHHKPNLPQTVGMAANQKEDSSYINKGWSGQNLVAPPAPVQPEISVDDKLAFWSYLTDVQFGKFDPAALTKMNTWIITGDGKWLVQKNRAGYFGVKKSEEGIETLPKGTIKEEAFVHLNYGKIPQNVLDQIIAFFRGIMQKHSGAEGFVQVYWDCTEEKYMVHVPSQVVSGAAVKYDKTKDLDKVNPERYVFVYECHSHNNMGAFWSGTDNADENDLRLFGVYGHLGKTQWAHKHRCFVGEEEIDLSLDLIFNIDRVTESQYEVTTDSGEIVVVNQSDIAIDEAPRFMVQSGENMYTVRKEAIKKIQAVVDVPESWYSEVNTTSARAQVSEVWNGQGKPWKHQSRATNYSNSPFIPGNKDDEEKEAAEMSYSEEFAMEEAIDKLAELTNDFEDVGMCSNLCQVLEDKDLLGALKNTLLAYSGDFPMEDMEMEEGQYEGYAAS